MQHQTPHDNGCKGIHDTSPSNALSSLQLYFFMFPNDIRRCYNEPQGMINSVLKCELYPGRPFEQKIEVEDVVQHDGFFRKSVF